MSVISSTGNATVKSIRSLRRRKERDASGLFYVEGVRLVGEAAEQAAEVETCVVAPELLRSEYAWSIVDRLTARGTARLEVRADVFRSLSLKDGPQGIAAVVRQRWETIQEIEPGNELCWIALLAVQDPGNLGTILRTSDAVGAAGVFLVGDTADPFDPQAVRAGMGAIFSQRLARTTVQELRSWKDRYGATVIGTSDGAQCNFREAAYPSPLVLFMGSEREGLGAAESDVCDHIVRIPMVGRSDSLNLAVSTGVMLYEIMRQRTSPE